MQVDQDKLIDKVRSSQSEILMINKNLASNLKMQRSEIAEIQNKSSLNMTLIESLLVQAISMEQLLQYHLDHCMGADQGSINIKPSMINIKSQDVQPPFNNSVMSSNTSMPGNSARYKSSNNRLAPPFKQGADSKPRNSSLGNIEQERQYLTKANEQLRRCQISLFRYQKSIQRQSVGGERVATNQAQNKSVSLSMSQRRDRLRT